MLLVCILMIVSSCSMNKRIKHYPRHAYSKANDRNFIYNARNGHYYFKW